MKICAECGHGNDDTVTFCAECGEFLDWELDTGSRAAQPADTATSGTKVPIGPRPPSRPPDATDTPDVEPPGSEMEDPDTPADRRDAAPPPPSPSGETDESAVEGQAADSGSRTELNALAARLAIRPASARAPDEDDSPARDGIAEARAVAQRRGRDDLVHRLDQEEVSVRRGLVRVAVVGHF
jgi:hypothetical protein